mmetsp:Transcript_123348/g.334942  ORF Transcript_123348/g.334942 Transcript_123348/m.334942 type:complete len:246 (-) Transcript_123348:962-1699(-)
MLYLVTGHLSMNAWYAATYVALALASAPAFLACAAPALLPLEPAAPSFRETFPLTFCRRTAGWLPASSAAAGRAPQALISRLSALFSAILGPTAVSLWSGRVVRFGRNSRDGREKRTLLTTEFWKSCTNTAEVLRASTAASLEKSLPPARSTLACVMRRKASAVAASGPTTEIFLPFVRLANLLTILPTSPPSLSSESVTRVMLAQLSGSFSATFCSAAKIHSGSAFLSAILEPASAFLTSPRRT